MRLGDLDALKMEFEKVYPSSGGVANKQIYNIIDNASKINPCDNCDLYFIAKTKEEMRKGGAE